MNHLANIESYFGHKLPESYARFLKNHAMETHGDTCLYLAEDIIERNQTYETIEYASGYISIGDDGGGRAFLIKFTEDDPEVFLIDHGSMDPDEKELVCSSFSKWMELSFAF